MYFVYAIGNSIDIKNKRYSNCYIGVTNNLHLRWSRHSKSKYTVGEAIRMNNWNFVDNMKIIFFGTEEMCFDIETKLRPIPMLGLNEAAGGHGGKTPCTPERNAKISKALTGRPKSIAHRNEISKTRILKGICSREKNPRAFNWTLIDPAGLEYKFRGALQHMCDKLNLCLPALRENLDSVVGEISPKFRDNGNLKFRTIRINTIGWKLIKET